MEYLYLFWKTSFLQIITDNILLRITVNYDMDCIMKQWRDKLYFLKGLQSPMNLCPFISNSNADHWPSQNSIFNIRQFLSLNCILFRIWQPSLLLWQVQFQLSLSSSHFQGCPKLLGHCHPSGQLLLLISGSPPGGIEHLLYQ